MAESFDVFSVFFRRHRSRRGTSSHTLGAFAARIGHRHGTTILILVAVCGDVIASPATCYVMTGFFTTSGSCFT
jgi:hypothetical protein